MSRGRHPSDDHDGEQSSGARDMTALASMKTETTAAPSGVTAVTYPIYDGDRCWVYGWTPGGPVLCERPTDGRGTTLDPPEHVRRAAAATGAAMTRAVAGFARRQDALQDLAHVTGSVAPVLSLAVAEGVPGARRAAAELRTWATRRRHEGGTTGDLRAVLGDLDTALGRALDQTRRTPAAQDRGGTPETLAKSGHRAITGLIGQGTIRADGPEARAAREIGELMRYLPLLGTPRAQRLDDEPRGDSAGLQPAGYQGLPHDLAAAHRTRYQPWMREQINETIRRDGEGGVWSRFDVVRYALLEGYSLRDIDTAMGTRRHTARESLLAALRDYAEMAGW